MKNAIFGIFFLKSGVRCICLHWQLGFVIQSKRKFIETWHYWGFSFSWIFTLSLSTFRYLIVIKWRLNSLMDTSLLLFDLMIISFSILYRHRHCGHRGVGNYLFNVYCEWAPPRLISLIVDLQRFLDIVSHTVSDHAARKRVVDETYLTIHRL